MTGLSSVQEGPGTPCFQAARVHAPVPLLPSEQRMPRGRDCTFTDGFTLSPTLGSPRAPFPRLFRNCCLEDGTTYP